MSQRKATGILIAALIWVIIIAGLAVAAKYLILPYFEEKLEENTGSDGLFKHEIRLALDSFSGYCILRSDAMKRDLQGRGIRLSLLDDKANYEQRMTALINKEIHMAVFTVDSFVLTGARHDSYPATIVMVIDETKGADAIVAYKDAVSNVQDLDDPQARIVLTPSSPSEFLARTVIAHFSLPRLPTQWWEAADGSGDVYQRFVAADPKARRAYVLWEPWVSRALEREGAHLLLDSSRLKGYIVDVLVAERKFLRDHPDLARDVTEAYLRAAFAYSQTEEDLIALVSKDSESAGALALSEEQAKKLVTGIEWKNTLENYAYFGLAPADRNRNLQHIEEVIGNITDVLVKTEALNRNPLEGRTNIIYYDQILKELQAADFHPGKKVNLIENLGSGTENLNERLPEAGLRELTVEEWETLVPVGTLRINPISFARGTARINIQSRREMARLAKNMEAWPKYYVLITGHARAEGEPQANLRLARQRAEASRSFLIDAGVAEKRIRVLAAPSKTRGGSAQSVSFELLQLPY
ncbi:MAG: OmpA family protein [Acidobacteria bacterium]|nr:OmpA family protein [Acidobacteriota bacterium]